MGLLRLMLMLFSLESACPKRRTIPRALFRNILAAGVLGFWDFYSLYYKIIYIYAHVNLSVKLTDTCHMIFDYCQYIVDIYFVYKYGKVYCVEYYKQYDRIDKILSMSYSSAAEKRAQKLVLVVISIWLINCSFDFFAWYMGYGFIMPLAYSVAYVFLLIRILTVLDLTSQVIQLECRLRAIGDLIHDQYNGANKLPEAEEMFGDSVNNNNWFYSDSRSHVVTVRSALGTLKLLNHSQQYKLHWLICCYLMLTEQCSYINRMFGFRILFNSLSLLIDMIRYANVAVRIVNGTQVVPFSDGYYYCVVAGVMRLFTCTCVLVTAAHHCQNAYYQRERIINTIDHILIIKNPCPDLRKGVTKLRDFICAKPIDFNMANFFSLNYSFLLSIASVFVTYTIILLQSLN